MTHSTHTISILGCGWLGHPLGRRLVEAGHQVNGSTTTPEKISTLQVDGIRPYLLRLTPELETAEAASFFDADVLFLNIPPDRTANDPVARYRTQVRAATEAAVQYGISWIVFVSATSVYPSAGQEVVEDDATPHSERARVLLEAERVVRESGCDYTILRYAGLIGGERHPGRFLAGRTQVAGGDARLNLIHQTDAVGVAQAVLTQEVRNDIFNVCAPEHPRREPFYQAAAKAVGQPPPTFDAATPRPNKVVNIAHLQECVNYTFEFPNPMQAVT